LDNSKINFTFDAMKAIEREAIKVAKAQHKEALKNPALYKRKRDEILMAMVDSPTPQWGAVKVIVSKIK
jgi:hypothetical protein